jgi:hypothetical protein
MTELTWRSKMTTENDTTKRQLSYRIISWNAAQACRLILEETKSRIDRCGYEGSIFEWPANRKAIEWLTNLPTLKNRGWPLVVEVGSHGDTNFSSILESTKAWLSKSTSIGWNTSLAVFLRPFPVFQSSYLESGFESLQQSKLDRLVRKHQEARRL